MKGYLFTVPLASGKTETWKRYMKEISGARNNDYKQSRKRLGLNTEQVFLQQTPHGDMCVVRWETEKPKQVFENLAKSNDPFDKWFREKVLIECHDMDLSQPIKINEQFINHSVTPTHEFA